MRNMDFSRKRVIAALAGALAIAAIGAPTASAAEPWWHVTVSSRPSRLKAGRARDEIQEIKVAATAGDVAVIEPVSLEKYEKGEGYPKYTLIAYDATHQQAQEKLEEIYGPGSVEVAGGPGDAAGAKPYVVTFTGAQADQPLKLMNTSYSKISAALGGVDLEGEATVSQRVEGRADGTVVLLASNVGDAAVNGSSEPVKIVANLPSGLKAVGVEAKTANPLIERAPVSCSLNSATQVTCAYESVLPVYEAIEVDVSVVVQPGASARETGVATVSGGGAPALSVSRPLAIGGQLAFGVQSYEVDAEAEGGLADAYAGSHPFQLTTTLDLSQTGEADPVALAKDLSFKLPAGLIGNPAAVPRCTLGQFLKLVVHENGTKTSECRQEAAIGVAIVTYRLNGEELETVATPVFNLEAARGEPARFGFDAPVPVLLDTSVRGGSDYGVTVSVRNISQLASVLSSQVTFWGAPGNPSHDAQRGFQCLGSSIGYPGYACSALAEHNAPPLLTLPSSCEGALQSTVEADSWQLPGAFEDFSLEESLPAMQGCNRERFEPDLEMQSSTTAAESPTEVTVHLKVPQEASEAPEGTAEADVKNATVTLPAGLQVNPAAAAGLKACAENEIGYTGRKGTNGELLFVEESEAEKAHEAAEKYTCPDASKLGKVTITTPLLKEDLTGWVYQAAQEANPFGSLLAIYVIAEAPQRGVRVRLAGDVEVLPGGQLKTTFPDTPQLPFEEFKLKFFGGPQGALATTGCGVYKTESSIEPWSSPSHGAFLAHPSSEFDVPASACAGLGGFKPAFVAGTSNNDAGSFSPFTMTLKRGDGEQALSTVAMSMPKGLAGMIANVAQCPTAIANAKAWHCPAASQVGHVVVHAGIGKEPIELPEAGKPQDPVYLTGPYDGAPFGLAIVVPAEAGPLNLDEGGHPVVVRAKIEINPVTAQVSIVSGAMPTELRNINLDVRSIEVVVDHPDFMFNPTSCEEQQLTGTVGSASGASATVGSRFQAADCAALSFKPQFSALIRAHHTKKNGEYLHVVIGSAFGQANLREVHVTLPAKLPSRDSTLKLACTEAQFAADPAGCPPGSFVGHAVVHTPVLAKPLVGPAIFVSHGGRAFPNLDLVLQGEGVTIINEGDTFISKKGITTSSFNAIPDVPVSRISLVLPAGPHSALAGTGNMCAEPLHMPATLTGQNGAVVSRRTKIMVEGCKAQIAILKHRVHGAKATIILHVPAAGSLTANGRGISKVSKQIKKHGGRVGITVTLTRHFRSKLRRAHRHHIRVPVHLKFKPRHGKTITAHVNVTLR